MNLYEELLWRGFSAQTTIDDISILDSRDNKKFYWGADPSADSLTIGNLAALMMCVCFARHGYEPYLLVGGATGQIGDPKENGERELKPLEEVEHNKNRIQSQISRIFKNALELKPSSDLESKSLPKITFLDNLDWFKDIKFLDFLREIGKSFSMTQLLDRQFVQNRIGKNGSGISYAEFSYTLIQGYDFLHIFRKYGVSLELCGADQYGNCASGIHLIRRLENATADVWSTPLIIDPISGKKFGKSEGNAIWLASAPGKTPSGTLSENFTSVFDFYQFWLNQPDSAVESLLKTYTLLGREEIDQILEAHAIAPERRTAQKSLAKNVTVIVHGPSAAEDIEKMTRKLFDKSAYLEEDELKIFSRYIPTVNLTSQKALLDVLVETGLCSSKSDARKSLKSGAISIKTASTDSFEKIFPIDETRIFSEPSLIKKGKNKFAILT